jgi:hypothetical protein
MAQYFTDFTEYADTAALEAEWNSAQYSTTSLFEIDLQATGGKNGGPALRSLYTSSPGSFERTGISWNGVVPDTADVEVVARFKTNSAGFSENNRYGILTRGAGSGTSVTAYISPYFRGATLISSYAGGNYLEHTSVGNAGFSADTWYWMRVQTIGSALKARWWTDGDTEPGTWDIDITNTRISAAGFVGLWHAGSGPSNVYCDLFSVGTNGDSALTENPRKHVSTVTIPAAQVAADLTDYCAYIDLSTLNSEFWELVTSGGGDIRLFKEGGVTELPREVVSCDAITETGELHFLYTGTLSSSVDNVIEVHVDGISADYDSTAKYGRNAVWSDYEGVWHGDDTTDSTGKSSDLTAGGSASAGNAGKLGGAFDFATTMSNYFKVTGSGFADLTASTNVSIQQWLYRRSDRSFDFYEEIYGSVGVDNGYSWGLDDPQHLTLFTDGANTSARAGKDLPTAAWVQQSIVWDPTADTVGHYLDGLLDGTSTGYTDTSAHTSPDVWIGVADTAVYTDQEGIDGLIDETRIRYSKLSSDWISTEYTNQNTPGTFYTVTKAPEHVTDITIPAAQVAGDLTNYVGYLDLSTMNEEFWSSVANGGGDIRVFKEGGFTELAREVVACDTATETGELHFRDSGTLSSSVDNVFELYTDGASADYAATDTYGRNAVWSGYEFVSHDGGATDSSGNTTPTIVAGTPAVNTDGGALGKSYSSFDGTDDRYDTTITANGEMGITLQSWNNASQFSADDMITLAASPLVADALNLRWDEGTDEFHFGPATTGTNPGLAVAARGSLTTGEWFKLDGAWSTGNTSKVYLNGVQYAGSTTGDGGLNVGASKEIEIGGVTYNGSFREWFGDMDEVRIIFKELSSDWIATEYANQSSPGTFYSATSLTPGVTLSDLLTVTITATTVTARVTITF